MKRLAAWVTCQRSHCGLPYTNKRMRGWVGSLHTWVSTSHLVYALNIGALRKISQSVHGSVSLTWKVPAIPWCWQQPFRPFGWHRKPASLLLAGIGHHLPHFPSLGLSTHLVIRASRPQVNCLPACWMTAAVRSPDLCQYPCSSRLGVGETGYPYLSEALTSLVNCIFFSCVVIYAGGIDIGKNQTNLWL